MDKPISRQTPPQPLQPLELPGRKTDAVFLYHNSVVGITDERMRQLAEHFSP